MRDYEPIDIEPTVHNAKDKYDVLDWKNIPRYTCDLNYRLPSGHSASDLPSAVATIFWTAFATTCVRWLLAAGPAVFVSRHTSLAVVAVIATLISAKPLIMFSSARQAASGLAAFVGAFLVWGVLIFIAQGNNPPMALAAMVMFGLPCIGVAADQVATHYVHWLTANPQIDRETMTGWRRDWRWRFAGISDRPPCQSDLDGSRRRRFQQAMRFRRFYPCGFALVAGCLFLAIGMGVALTRSVGPDRFAVVVTLQMVVALSAVAAGYCVLIPRAPGVFFQALGSYYGYGKNAVDPPWVFQSPCGPRLVRRVVLIVVTGVLTILVATLAASQGLFAVELASPRALLLRPLVIGVLLPVLLSPVLLLLGSFVAIGPTLVGHHDALEAEEAPEQHLEWSDFDGYIERLRNSRNSIERAANIIGFHRTFGFPILADTNLYFEHQHVLGATGIGKTALSVATDLIQLIRRGDGPVIVVDCKGDRALFETARLESARAGRKFKWFTNKPYRSTYIFNPLAHLSSPQFALPEVLGVLLQSFNMFHGEEYARAYFGKAVRILLRAAYLATTRERVNRRGYDPHASGYSAERIESFWDLDDILQDLAADNREYEAAKHLTMLVQSLCDFDQLNLTASRDPNEPAVHHAISMPEVIREKQVVYFYLVGTMDQASVGEIARLALFATNSAAVQYRDQTSKRPRIYFIADEAQCLLAKNVETVLQQARDSGIGFLLAHQSLSQLNLPGGIDLTPQVMNSTCIKRYHSARDAAAQKYISEISGTTKYYSRSWRQFKYRVVNGLVGSRYACTDADDVKRIDISEQLGPRLEPEDIRDINRDINQSIVIFERNSGYSQYLGAFPMVTEWPMPARVNRDRARQPWPVNEEETITIMGAWPEPNSETVTRRNPPGIEAEVDPEEVDESLRRMRRRLMPDEEDGGWDTESAPR